MANSIAYATSEAETADRGAKGATFKRAWTRISAVPGSEQRVHPTGHPTGRASWGRLCRYRGRRRCGCLELRPWQALCSRVLPVYPRASKSASLDFPIVHPDPLATRFIASRRSGAAAALPLAWRPQFVFNERPWYHRYLSGEVTMKRTASGTSV